MIILLSWGFKFGRPLANFTFDVSYLKNPWRQKELQNADFETIFTFMKAQKEFIELTNTCADLIQTYEKLWPKETLIFAFCCSAGEYRSPAVVEQIAQILKSCKIKFKIKHNDNNKLK